LNYYLSFRTLGGLDPRDPRRVGSGLDPRDPRRVIFQKKLIIFTN